MIPGDEKMLLVSSCFKFYSVDQPVHLFEAFIHYGLGLISKY